jgi:hypothetical protein
LLKRVIKPVGFHDFGHLGFAHEHDRLSLKMIRDPAVVPLRVLLGHTHDVSLFLWCSFIQPTAAPVVRSKLRDLPAVIRAALDLEHFKKLVDRVLGAVLIDKIPQSLTLCLGEMRAIERPFEP